MTRQRTAARETTTLVKSLGTLDAMLLKATLSPRLPPKNVEFCALYKLYQDVVTVWF